MLSGSVLSEVVFPVRGGSVLPKVGTGSVLSEVGLSMSCPGWVVPVVVGLVQPVVGPVLLQSAVDKSCMRWVCAWHV